MLYFIAIPFILPQSEPEPITGPRFISSPIFLDSILTSSLASRWYKVKGIKSSCISPLCRSKKKSLWPYTSSEMKYANCSVWVPFLSPGKHLLRFFPSIGPTYCIFASNADTLVICTNINWPLKSWGLISLDSLIRPNTPVYSPPWTAAVIATVFPSLIPLIKVTGISIILSSLIFRVIFPCIFSPGFAIKFPTLSIFLFIIYTPI